MRLGEEAQQPRGGGLGQAAPNLLHPRYLLRREVLYHQAVIFNFPFRLSLALPFPSAGAEEANTRALRAGINSAFKTKAEMTSMTFRRMREGFVCSS